MKKVVTLTMNPSLDVSARAEHIAPERKVRCKTIRYDPGGGGINVSRVLKRFGINAATYYNRGGPTGDILDRMVVQTGLDGKAMPIRQWTRLSFAALDESTSQQFRFSAPSPPMSEPEWRNCLDTLKKASLKGGYLVAGGSLPDGVPLDFYGRISRLVKEQESRLILDTSGPAFREALEQGVFMIKPNFREFQELIGKKLDNEQDQETAARQLIEEGKCAVVLVSLGAAGALFVSSDKIERLRAPTVCIESKVGAGDSMVAGFACALAHERSFQDAARFAVASGAAAVMTPGTELSRPEDVKRLYLRIKNQESPGTMEFSENE